MPTESPVAKDSPLWRAWQAYKETPEYANTLHWAVQPEHAEGSLWAAFSVGFLGSSGAGTPHDTPDGAVTTLRDAARMLYRVDGEANRASEAFDHSDFHGALSLAEELEQLADRLEPAPRETPDADDLLAFLDDTFSGGNEIRFCPTSEPVGDRSRTEERDGATIVWVDEPLPVNEFGDTERRHECLSDALRAWYKRDARTVESQPAPSETPDDTARLDDLPAMTALANLVRRAAFGVLRYHGVPGDREHMAGHIAVTVCMTHGLSDAMRETLADGAGSHLPTSETTDG